MSHWSRPVKQHYYELAPAYSVPIIYFGLPECLTAASAMYVLIPLFILDAGKVQGGRDGA